MHDEGFSFLTSEDGRPVSLTAEAGTRLATNRRKLARFVALAVRLPGSLTIGSGAGRRDRPISLRYSMARQGVSAPAPKPSLMNLLESFVDVTHQF
jgi:hypothetical protein